MLQEESIGIDCITKGKYGYIDPTGEVREYSYSSGVRCDPLTRQVIPKPVYHIKGTVSKILYNPSF